MKVFIFFGFVITIGLAASVPETQPYDFVEDDDVYYPAANWSNSFDWKLFKELAPKYKNIVISPISLKIVLTMLYQGAAGSTRRELESVLQFEDRNRTLESYRDVVNSLQKQDNRNYILDMGSRIFLDTSLEPKESFTNLSREVFKADIQSTNFTDIEVSAFYVNQWVDKLTEGHIRQLVHPEDLKDAIMILTNAIYFKGSWRHQFNKTLTQNGNFLVPYNENFLSIVTPFMTTVDKFYFLESPTLDVKIIRLPYKGGRYSMFIILPNSIGGLPSLLKKVNLFSLKSLLYLMDLRQVKVVLPRFKYDFQARYSKVLKDFGLIQMFQNTASFPGIVKGQSSVLRKLVVSDIIQKSGVAIDEEGSVVYSASGITIGNKMGDNPDEVFEATHPFMFFVEDESTGTILFLGKVENPLDQDVVPMEAKLEN